MAIRGFFCQNVASGCAFGGFGVTVVPLQQKFGTSLGMATLGLALTVLVIGLVSPFVATLLGRFGLRRTMTAGAVFSGLGYILLAFAPNMATVLFAYAVPIGVGLTMFGPFPSSVLASSWFRDNPGPALGFVNMPVFLALIPLIGQMVIRDHGLMPFYLILAALHLLLLPLSLGIAEAPVEAVDASSAGDAASSHGMTAGEVLRQPIFWVIVAGGGALNAAAISGIAHLFSFGLERNIPPEQAAMLLSLLGGASILGSLLIGLLCGRLGATRTLALLGIGFSLSWLVLLITSELALMSAAAMVIGASGAGTFPAISMLSGRSFGQASMARVIGLFSLLTSPLTVCLPPLAGVLHDATGSYNAVAMTIIGGGAAVAILFLLTTRLAIPRAPMVPAAA
jgi:cyanate permease